MTTRLHANPSDANKDVRPFEFIRVPKEGERITVRADGSLIVPDFPIIAFIEGDGIGPDIWQACREAFDAAVWHCYKGQRRIAWMEVYAGEKAASCAGTVLPDETIEAIRHFVVAIKGPLTTPVGGGFRSLNVALRQSLDLFACVRPVRYFHGVPSPVRRPEAVDMVIFRESTEDVYGGWEVEQGSEAQRKLQEFCRCEFGWEFPDDAGFGIKVISRYKTQRLMRAAIRYALRHNRKKITVVHKGNIMKHTEGAFQRWAYEVAESEFPEETVPASKLCSEDDTRVCVNDVIADAFLQHILMRPRDFEIIVAPNLNGDYISDALAAQVGGIGVAPGANINFETGVAIFEPTHGSVPKYARQDKVNPSSLLLSGVMMFEYLGWQEVADTLTRALEATYSDGIYTYDFARLTPYGKEVRCSEFARAVVERLGA